MKAALFILSWQSSAAFSPTKLWAPSTKILPLDLSRKTATSTRTRRERAVSSTFLFAETTNTPESNSIADSSSSTTPQLAVNVEPTKQSTESSGKEHQSPIDTKIATEAAVFDFRDDKTVDQFERIDDSIMGGISTSSVKNVDGENYASWSGILRLDGGGFCGMRTLPFKSPLNATGYDGVYVKCRFVSDDEPHKRVWKVSMRTDSSRGEQVYQQQFELPPASANNMNDNGDKWTQIKIPFDSFTLVRGARKVLDGPKLDSTQGVFQIGMTMSKFIIAENMTAMDDFRPGFFQMHIESMGLYRTEVDAIAEPTVETLTEQEAKKKRPLLLKVLRPISKIFFSEQANRRKSAMKILMGQKKGRSRLGAILYGMRLRAKNNGFSGMIFSLIETFKIIGIDVIRTVLTTTLKFGLFYPLVFIRRGITTLIRGVKYFGQWVRSLFVRDDKDESVNMA